MSGAMIVIVALLIVLATSILPALFILRNIQEGKGASAVVRSTGPGARGFVQVVLDVTLDGEELGERAFRRG